MLYFFFKKSLYVFFGTEQFNLYEFIYSIYETIYFWLFNN